MRRVLWFALALTAFLALPREAAAQHQLCVTGGPVACAKPSAGPWTYMTFGPASFVKPKPAGFIQVSGSGLRATHTVKGTSGLATAFGAKAAALPAIDCAMARPAEHNFDPGFVKPAPMVKPLGHGGVTVPIAPCPKK